MQVGVALESMHLRVLLERKVHTLNKIYPVLSRVSVYTEHKHSYTYLSNCFFGNM